MQVCSLKLRSLELERINLPNALTPVSPYCHAVRAGDFLFLSGQVPQDPETNQVKRGSIEDQTRQVMENLKLILEHAGSSFEQVVMSRVFITDLRFLPAVNQIYAAYFGDGQVPTRTAIGVTGLAGLADIEIDVIAYCGK
jgi:2-iminobutanoate/2-iminopropanoate deaminase